MKVKFSSDDDLAVDKPSRFYNLKIIIRSVFEENDKMIMVELMIILLHLK